MHSDPAASAAGYKLGWHSLHALTSLEADPDKQVRLQVHNLNGGAEAFYDKASFDEWGSYFGKKVRSSARIAA